MKTGMDLINEERARQVEVEGYSNEHDDAHSRGELALAGLSYFCAALRPVVAPPFSWPFEDEGWKPEGGPERCLVKAGALYLAESLRWMRAGNHDEARRYSGFAAECAEHLDLLMRPDPVERAIRSFGGRLEGGAL